MTDAACGPSNLDRSHGVDGVSETVETIRGAQVAADARGGRADGAACGGGELEEWFAQAAAGDVPFEGDTSRRLLLAAATLPVHDATVRPRRPRRGVLRAPCAPRLRHVQGRGLAMMAFVWLVVLAVVTLAATRALDSSTSAPRSEVVTSTGAPIEKLGDMIERSMTVEVAQDKRASQRRRLALQARERKANERSARVKRRVGMARHRFVRRSRVGIHTRVLAPASAARDATSRARVAPAQTSERTSVLRRSSCGPFDLC
jgi:hypothetical protein